VRYAVEVTASPGTSVTVPEVRDIALTDGVITRITLYFPPGSGGNLRVQLWLNGYQLLPWERGEWVRGDDVVLVDDSQYRVDEEPYLAIVKAYNTGTLYDHAAQVSIDLTPFTISIAPAVETDLIGRRFD
jgi:hypothetical protein